jgi:DNA replication protein DnaC
LVSRRKKRQHAAEESLGDVISKAWSAFEDPENQERIQRKDESSAARAEAERQRLCEKELRMRGVPKKIAELIADGAVSSTPAVFELTERKGMLLVVLAGNTGCGKTLAACTWMQDRPTGRLVRATELSEIGRGWREREELASLRRVGLLVVDDLGVEEDDRRLLQRLDDMVDARISAGYPTLMTTNLTADEFKHRYGNRIWSRLHEHGDFIELDDPDLRVEG